MQPERIRRARICDHGSWMLFKPGQTWEDGDVGAPPHLHASCPPRPPYTYMPNLTGERWCERVCERVCERPLQARPSSRQWNHRQRCRDMWCSRAQSLELEAVPNNPAPSDLDPRPPSPEP